MPRNGKTATAVEVVEDKIITLRRLAVGDVVVPIIGTAPLIVHRFSEKAKKQIKDRAALPTRAKLAKVPQVPEEDYQASRYILPDGRDGFPASGFKSAIGSAARHFDELTLVAMKVTIFPIGEGPDNLVPIIGDRTMREDTVRTQAGGSTLCWRAAFWPWSAELRIRYLASGITEDSVFALIDASGWGGIGEWRPSSPKSMSGTFGTYRVGEG